MAYVEAAPTDSVAAKLRAIGDAASELPGLRRLAIPLYRRRFQRPFGDDNSYYGVYGSFADAEAAAQALSTRFLPPTYDTEAAGRAYRNQLARIRVSDYPLVYWLSKLLSGGCRHVFDLGGNIGVSYYGFGHYIDYPADLRWRLVRPDDLVNEISPAERERMRTRVERALSD